jgi:transcription elongation factor GreA
MSGPVHYLTPEGKQKLQDELRELTTVRRQQIANDLRRAIEEGDLSENFGYSETKRQQALLEGRIHEVQAILATAETLTVGTDGFAALGSTVEIQEPGEKPECYQIVGPTEADPARGRISHVSPLGRAILGHRVGDHVEVNTPGGTLSFDILRVE